VTITYEWRGDFANDEINHLHAEAFETTQDTMVSSGARRRGVGTELVSRATDAARAAGCEYLHVDFDDHLRGFYFDACGFRPTNAGLIKL
jgi:GNAT superfamily N-acetyltransferase